MFVGIMTLLTGLILLYFSLVFKTKNLRSSVIFKFIPMIFAIFNILQALKLLEVLTLNW